MDFVALLMLHLVLGALRETSQLILLLTFCLKETRLEPSPNLAVMFSRHKLSWWSAVGPPTS